MAGSCTPGIFYGRFYLVDVNYVTVRHGTGGNPKTYMYYIRGP
jgi:hypothetical protein